MTTTNELSLKKKNKRITFCIINQDGECYVRIITKRLESFKERKIIRTDMVYTLDTITCIVFSLYQTFSDDSFQEEFANQLQEVIKEKWRVE